MMVKKKSKDVTQVFFKRTEKKRIAYFVLKKICYLLYFPLFTEDQDPGSDCLSADMFMKAGTGELLHFK